MKTDPAEIHVAIVGAGMSGAACAAGLRLAGVQVTVFDKSRNVGGRMASRRASWTDAAGIEHPVTFDHGTQC
ncbi:MAG: FAD-dependent oxidoreductase, partial [Rhizobiales bacterium]|nr:FAD-dependent oxidoreductase [Rhizobacter sp.]